MIVHVKNNNKNQSQTVEGAFETLSDVIEELSKYQNYDDLCPPDSSFVFRRGDLIGKTINYDTQLKSSMVNNEVFISVTSSKISAGNY